jgi:hypothetical protein
MKCPVRAAALGCLCPLQLECTAVDANVEQGTTSTGKDRTAEANPQHVQLQFAQVLVVTLAHKLQPIPAGPLRKHVHVWHISCSCSVCGSFSEELLSQEPPHTAASWNVQQLPPCKMSSLLPADVNKPSVSLRSQRAPSMHASCCGVKTANAK